MTNQDLTHIYVVLDRSGSMVSIADDMRGGFDAFIADQAKEPGECKVTLVQFDTSYEKVYEDKPIAKVPALKLQPRGGTALLDALGETITTVGEKLANLDEDKRPGAVIFCIITDGEENSSREFDLPQVRKMIKRQQKDYEWLFMYLGANQDAISVARSMGIARGQTMTYAGVNTHSTVGGMSANTTAYRGAKASGLSHGEAVLAADFTEEQRDEATK